MFNFLTPYKALIEAALFAAALAFIAFEVHQFMDRQQDIGYNRAVTEFAAKKIVEDQAAAKIEAATQKQLEQAQHDAGEREKSLQATTAVAVAASNSLRDTLTAIRNGVPTATSDALRQTTSVLGDILTECQDRRRGVAEEAERLNSEKQTLIEAWPR